MNAEFARTWELPALALGPLVPFTGPFPLPSFLTAWASVAAPPGAATLVVSSPDGAMPIWVDGDTIRFQGEADLTDYHSPLGHSIDACIALISRRYAGHRFSFDSLPAEAIEPLERSLAGQSARFTTSKHAAALTVDLPGDYQAWLSSLSKKHRHEVRRKQRRFVDLVGAADYERRGDPEAFAAFVGMHRKADGEKGMFMTEQAEVFFKTLLTEAAATIDLLSVEGRPVAAAFGFAQDDAYYLYNSAYEPELIGAAPGIVLLASMIERSITDGLSRFDFLKGDERYKYHLGGVERPLSVIEGSFA
ncbi:MAG: GNAT family N-acetyltransferase [Acidimicrobiia bacterium]